MRAYLCLTIAAFCWGGNAVFARLAVGEVSPFLLVCLRWSGAVLLLAVFARKPIIRDWRILKPHIPRLFIMGMMGFTAFNALLYVAAYTTSAVNIGIIQGSIPIFVLLGTLIWHQAIASALQWVGVFVTVLGVCIVATQGELAKIASMAMSGGDYLMVIACILYAGYALGLRKYPTIPALSLFAVVAAAALITSIPLAFYEYFQGDYQSPSAFGWVVVGLVTLGPSFIAQICFIQGVTDIGPGRAGIFINLVPVFAALLAVSIIAEPFFPYHGVALLLVVSGIGLAERKTPPRKK